MNNTDLEIDRYIEIFYTQENGNYSNAPGRVWNNTYVGSKSCGTEDFNHLNSTVSHYLTDMSAGKVICPDLLYADKAKTER